MTALIEHPAGNEASAALVAAGHLLPLAQAVEVGLVLTGPRSEFERTIRALVLRGPSTCVASAAAAQAFARTLLERGHATALLVGGPGSLRVIETVASARARGV